jgi:hypothetical protein
MYICVFSLFSDQSSQQINLYKSDYRGKTIFHKKDFPMLLTATDELVLSTEQGRRFTPNVFGLLRGVCRLLSNDKRGLQTLNLNS